LTVVGVFEYGALVGEFEAVTVGKEVGNEVSIAVGEKIGLFVEEIVGKLEGTRVDSKDGIEVETLVGIKRGKLEGNKVGAKIGIEVGNADGEMIRFGILDDGEKVGAADKSLR
jgi:hypothetical protein